MKVIKKLEHEPADVYNMEVKDTHCFAVTKSNIIIHNCSDALRYLVMETQRVHSIENITRRIGL